MTDAAASAASASQPPPAERRVGVVVPPGNPVVEPELHALVAPALFPYAARFPRHADLDLPGRLARYVDDTPDIVASLRDVPVAATYLACTGSSYGLDADGNQAWIESAAAVTGSVVVTAEDAVTSVLVTCGVERLRIVSPYPAWLTRQCVDHWTGAGFSVAGVHEPAAGDGGAHAVYTIGARAIAAAVEEAVDAASSVGGHADAVLVAGTGVATVAALDRLAVATDTLLVSSNVAAARWLLMATGFASAIATSGHAALSRLPTGAGR